MKHQNSVDEYDQSIIRTIREDKKWSRRELAERSGITQQTILNVEQNRFPASLSTLTAITESLGISFSEYVKLSHRCKTKLVNQKDLRVEPYSGYMILTYEYNDYIILHLDINESFDDIYMSQLPYFDIITYVLSGTLDMKIDDELHSIPAKHSLSYSGLSSRSFSCKGHCNFISILKRKSETAHHYNPLNELTSILELYTQQAVSRKPIPVNSDNMDFTIIKQLRNLHNMSLEKLADDSGMSTSAISLIENNKRAPSLATLSSIASVLGDTPVNLYYLAKKCETSSTEPAKNEEMFKHTKITVDDTVIDDIMFNFMSNTTGDEIAFGKLVNHPFCMEAQIPTSGELIMVVEDEEYTVKPGQMLVFDGSRPHKYRVSSDYNGLIVRIPKSKHARTDNHCNETEKVD